ncbi:uncharacterized protein AC631_01800 [Debaryomyces fabryi]|uniref:Receptor L-domain domain-containing protein n=1 Tax=Debaryomyces fabryi TaxID=58627 RepID=A0A0V1Q2M9_9ASCO|nr:uncharacterized protein AC631_01800 [Debaryomyces fabryi]KSA02431.1 hypothetical protein AC631_01800 [Debaryomyces fabryi]CUM54789.1 unnamed protein product [Debaryomyces fabryi]
MQFKTVLFTLATCLSLSGVQAKDSCSFSTTITAASAASQLNSCPTLDGKIEITGDEITSLDFSSVEVIKGDLKLFNSSSVTDVNLNQLSEISGSLTVQAYTQLHSLDLTSLSKAEELSLISLPSFAILNLNKGISDAGSIKISDTALSSLEGLTNYETVGSLDVDNNKNISSIDLSSLQSVKDTLVLSFNSDECEVKLDQLIWASNLTIQDVADFSASNLTKVNGTFNLAYNTFESVEFKKLKEVGGSLQIFANNDLTDISVDKLTTIGGEFRMFNNTELEDMEDSFSKLQTVEGAVNIEGNIANFTLPKLKEVDGTFTFETKSDEFDCSAFKKKLKKVVKGGKSPKCSAPKKKKSSSSKKGSSSTSSSSSSSTDSSSSGSSSSSSSSSTKSSNANVLINSTFILTIAIGAVFALFV